MNAQLNKRLHALMAQIVYDADQTHAELHRFASEQFGVESLSALTDEQAHALASKLQVIVSNLEQQIHKQLRRPVKSDGEPARKDVTISPVQMRYVKDMLHRLGWREEYFREMLNRRYDAHALEAMPAWKAVRLIAYMRRRLKHRRRSIKRRAA